jgi:hypothetical protein
MSSNHNSDPAIAPSADSPAEDRQKLRFGRAAVWVGAGIAIVAFVFYIGIGIYGGHHAAG